MKNATTYTIGYEREDGDFQVLATLNNNDGMMTSECFEAVKESLIHQLYNKLGAYDVITAAERQDVPDHVNIGE